MKKSLYAARLLALISLSPLATIPTHAIAPVNILAGVTAGAITGGVMPVLIEKFDPIKREKDERIPQELKRWIVIGAAYGAFMGGLSSAPTSTLRQAITHSSLATSGMILAAVAPVYISDWISS